MSKTLPLDIDLSLLSSTGAIGIGNGNNPPRTVLDVKAGIAGAGVLTLEHNYAATAANYAIKIIGDTATSTGAGYLGQYANTGGFLLAQGGRYRTGGYFMPDDEATGFSAVVGSNGNLLFHVNTVTAGAQFTPAERMRITTVGVGIGTNTPGVKLDVSDATVGSAVLARFMRSTGASAGDGNTIAIGSMNTQIGAEYAASGWAFKVMTGTGANSTERMRIDSAGNVGINTTAPAYPLDVRHATGGHIASGRTTNVAATSEPGNWYVVAPNASSNSRIWSAIRTVVSVATEGAEASSITFSSQKTGALVEAMRIDPNNNVGIGTTNPLQKLSVVGGIFVTGAATLGATSSSGLMSMESTVFRNYVGDGSGWSWAFSKRAASATTDLITVKDSGELLIGKTTVTANAGDVQLSKGLSFPASQVACSDPNTLDDYEEGTFTPLVNGSSTIGAGTYSPAAVGRYTKIGNRVFISGSIQWTAHTGTGNIIVAGFPFVQNSTANNRAVFSLVIDNLTYTGTSIVMIGVAGTATAAILNQTSNVVDSSVPMDTTGSIFFSGHYDI